MHKISIKLNRIKGVYYDHCRKVVCAAFVQEQLGHLPTHVQVQVILAANGPYTLEHTKSFMYIFNTQTGFYNALYAQAAFLLMPLFNGKQKIHVKIRVKDCTCTN